jgi:hypothetical protein
MDANSVLVEQCWLPSQGKSSSSLILILQPPYTSSTDVSHHPHLADFDIRPITTFALILPAFACASAMTIPGVRHRLVNELQTGSPGLGVLHSSGIVMTIHSLAHISGPFPLLCSSDRRFLGNSEMDNRRHTANFLPALERGRLGQTVREFCSLLAGVEQTGRGQCIVLVFANYLFGGEGPCRGR